MSELVQLKHDYDEMARREREAHDWQTCKAYKEHAYNKGVPYIAALEVDRKHVEQELDIRAGLLGRVVALAQALGCEGNGWFDSIEYLERVTLEMQKERDALNALVDKVSDILASGNTDDLEADAANAMKALGEIVNYWRQHPVAFHKAHERFERRTEGRTESDGA